MKIKELLERYGEDYEIKISFYACANTFIVPLKDMQVQTIDKENKVVVFDGEFN